MWGNRYEGGGTYKFWIAKRMTLATATFQGFAYPVGNRYGRDLGFAPAVPADVEIKALLFVDSDPKNVRTVTCSGKASPSGIFGAAQGMKPLPFDAPGEYLGHVLARYVDRDGHLWVCSMRHAGVVYPEDSPIVARGKKLQIGSKYVDRGETKFEGHLEADGTGHLAHINYPFLPVDVLLIASEQCAANKIEPVLNYDFKDKPLAYDTRLSAVGRSNLQLLTSNGYSPHLFPEYITDWAYYYSGAPRPGFMSRFLVGEDGVRAPYWHVSPNNFGGQINASNNGDLPGDLYRLIGGIVLRRKNQAPAYSGYLASAFILPPGSNNNRVIAAGSEELIGSDGTRARFFLVGTRPGMVYETGTGFTPAAQIDPVLPATVKFTLIYPDGRQEVTAGSGDKFGSWAGQRMTMDIPGVYSFSIEADWQGNKAFMPGLPNHGGKLYVIEKDRPANAPSLALNLKPHSVFSSSNVLSLLGSTSADLIEYAAVIPGAVVDQGTIQVQGGQFEFRWDPAAISQRTPTYDVLNLVNGRPEVFDVVHLTFFSREISADGTPYHSFVRLIIRGNKVLYTR
jgi:hypothetical protein